MTDASGQRSPHHVPLVQRVFRGRPKPVDGLVEPALGTRAGRAVFLVGGSLIAVSSGLEALGAYSLFAALQEARPAQGLSVPVVVLHAMFSAAVVLFAVGIRGRGSIVALRPLGTVMLIVYALAWLVPSIPASAEPDGLLVWLPVLRWIGLVAGLIGAIEIVRLRAIRGWTRFLPMVLVLAQLAWQFAFTVVASAEMDPWQQVGWGLFLVFIGIPLVALASVGVGVVAVVGALVARPTGRAAKPEGEHAADLPGAVPGDGADSP